MLSGIMISLAVIFSYTLALYLPDLHMRIACSLIFPFGLIAVIYLKLKLFTGMIVRFTNSEIEIRDLAVAYIGNIVGVIIAYVIFYMSGNSSSELIKSVAYSKLDNTYVYTFANAILCNIMVCLAVIMSRLNSSDFGKMTTCFLCISPMVFCGFEHCIANAFVFLTIISPDNIINILIHMCIVTLGNIIGGFLITKGVIENEKI